MTQSRSHLAFVATAGLFVAALSAAAVYAQAQGFAGKLLLRAALSGADCYVTACADSERIRGERHSDWAPSACVERLAMFSQTRRSRYE
jgi:hypothetical protein